MTVRKTNYFLKIFYNLYSLFSAIKKIEKNLTEDKIIDSYKHEEEIKLIGL